MFACGAVSNPVNVPEEVDKVPKDAEVLTFKVVEERVVNPPVLGVILPTGVELREVNTKVPIVAVPGTIKLPFKVVSPETVTDPGKDPEYTKLFTSFSQEATTGVVPSTKKVEAIMRMPDYFGMLPYNQLPQVQQFQLS